LTSMVPAKKVPLEVANTALQGGGGGGKGNVRHRRRGDSGREGNTQAGLHEVKTAGSRSHHRPCMSAA
jgi:hypothetical protein